MVVNPLGEILCEADENEAIMYADIGEFPLREGGIWLINKIRRCWLLLDKISLLLLRGGLMFTRMWLHPLEE
jgi:hypothetical protein